jgi:hypothetical protein
MPYRTVTGTLYRADQATVWASAPIVISPQFAYGNEISAITNASGVFTVPVLLPDSGNGAYVITLPGDVAVSFAMGAGSTTYDVSPLILTAESVAPVSQALTLTDGATVSWDTTLGRFGTLTLGGNRTLAAPTGLVAGAMYTLKLVQDGTGSRTLTWNAIFKFANGAAPILSTAAAAVDVFRFVSDGTSLWCHGTVQSDQSGQTLTDQATISWNTNLGAFASVTLAGNRTMAAPTNLQSGKQYVLKITQDGTGSRTITWNSVFKWATATAPTLSTAAAKVDLIRFECDGTNLYGVATIDVR